MTRINTISNMVCAALAASAIVCSCSKEEFSGQIAERAAKVRLFSLDFGGTDATRSSITTNYTIEWAIADELNYYTGKQTPVTPSDATKSFVIPSAGSGAKEIPVEYKDGDEYVVFYTKGSGNQSASVTKLTELSFSNAVLSSQDGSFAGNHISAVKTLLTSSSASLKPLQSFVKFTLGNLKYSDKIVNRIEVKGNNSEKICGDLKIQWPAAGATLSSTFTGTGNTITIDRSRTSFTADEEIFVAIIPQAYTKGLTVTLYCDDSVIATIKNEKNFTAQIGKIYSLGKLDDHKTIALSAVEIYPPLAAFGKEQQKKIWVKTVPSDWNGTITWKVENTAGETPKPISVSGKSSTFNCDYIRQLGDETIDGENYKVFMVTPTDGLTAEKDYGAAYLKLELRDKGVASTAAASGTAECKILIGRFIDLGLDASTTQHCLWGRRNLKGSDPVGSSCALNMCTLNENTFGDTYPWGGFYSYEAGNKDAGVTWGGVAFETSSGKYGGKYNTTDHKTALDLSDDVANKANSLWRIPSPSDCILLFTDTKTSHAEYTDGSVLSGISKVKVTSKILGYTDMSLIMYGHSMMGKEGTQFTNLQVFTNSTYPGSSCGCAIRLNIPLSGAPSLGGNWRNHSFVCVRPVRYESTKR